MVRPRKVRIVNFEPGVTYFKPQGVPLSSLEEVELTVDELEALRLANIERLSQTAAAEKMRIHQSTFHRTIQRAREKITDALINGKAIRIHGGEYMPGGDGTGPYGGARGPGGGRGWAGRMGGAGPGGLCACPKCDYTQPHRRGIPCYQEHCPRCGAALVRKEALSADKQSR